MSSGKMQQVMSFEMEKNITLSLTYLKLSEKKKKYKIDN